MNRKIQRELTQVHKDLVKVAKKYFAITNSPMGSVTGLIGEYIMANKLGLLLAEFNQQGYDALDNKGKKYQIKTSRIMLNKTSKGHWSAIKEHEDWEYLILCLLSEDYKLIQYYIISKANLPVIELKSIDLRTLSLYMKPTFSDPGLSTKYKLFNFSYHQNSYAKVILNSNINITAEELVLKMHSKGYNTYTKNTATRAILNFKQLYTKKSSIIDAPIIPTAKKQTKAYKTIHLLQTTKLNIKDIATKIKSTEGSVKWYYNKLKNTNPASIKHRGHI